MNFIRKRLAEYAGLWRRDKSAAIVVAFFLVGLVVYGGSKGGGVETVGLFLARCDADPNRTALGWYRKDGTTDENITYTVQMSRGGKPWESVATVQGSGTGTNMVEVTGFFIDEDTVWRVMEEQAE